MTATVTGAFLSAARFGCQVISDPSIGAAWDKPSALPRMSVGDVAGHLYLVVRRVDKHLDEPQPRGASRGRTMSYPRVDSPEDLDLEVHERVRLDGRHASEWGWEDLCRACADRVDKLERRLADAVPETITLGGTALDFEEYLCSRVVEVLVHSDDLLASVDAGHREPPAEALEIALPYLLDAARRVHGERAVLLAFTRRERVKAGIPSIY